MYPSITQYIFPSLLTTVYGFSSYSKYGNAFLALSLIFLFINILVSLETVVEKASFKSPFLIPKTNLSKKFICRPACPVYVYVYSFPFASV
ncbi:hypothetical protein D3C72_1747940 [compost metagenome]